MEFQDYYATLGVDRDATDDEIKKAYRKLARRYHPDISKEPDAEDKFKAVAEAYEVLKDPEKRAAYNELGEHWQSGENFRPPPDWSGFGGKRGFTNQGGAEAFEFDVFSDLFSAFYNAKDGSRPPPRPSQDAHTTYYATLEALYADLPVELDLVDPTTGTSRRLRVRIPAGLKDGQSFRLKGQGIPGQVGAATGDLFVELRIIPHPRFEVDGRNLESTLEVQPWEAVLGTRAKIETLGGTVIMTIPPGSRTGTRLRLKARGLPGKPRGDQFVTLKIQVPESVSPEQRKHYEALAETAASFD